MAIVLFFFRRLLFAKKTILFALIPLALCCMAPFAGKAMNPFIFFKQNLAFLMLMGPGVFLPMYFATRAFHEELESKTIVYLFTRPRSRTQFLLTKYFAAVLASLALLVPSALLMGAMLPGDFGRELFGETMQLVWVLVAAAFVYSAFFLWMGIALKRPVLLGMILSFGWENLASLLPGGFQSFTVMFYLRALLIESYGVEQFLDAKVSWENPSFWACWVTLAVIAALTLSVARVLIRRKEYA